MVYPYQFNAFSTPCELLICAPNAQISNSAAKAVLENGKRLERLYSFFRDDSEIYALNNRSTNIHLLSDELKVLINLSLFYSNITNNSFDIAMAGTLKEATKTSSIYHYNKEKERLSPYASSSNLYVDGNHLVFSNSITKIDLGGLVKEYAVDQSVMLLQSMGISSALVNFGGDIAAFGDYKGLPWRVGIQNPKNPQNNIMEVELNNASLCTSGHSKRYIVIQSKKISHVVKQLDMPEYYSQVSILAPTTIDAGVWSTAMLVNPELVLPSHVYMTHAIR